MPRQKPNRESEVKRVYLTQQCKAIHECSIVNDLPNPLPLDDYDGDSVEERCFMMLWDLQNSSHCPQMRHLLVLRMLKHGLANIHF